MAKQTVTVTRTTQTHRVRTSGSSAPKNTSSSNSQPRCPSCGKYTAKP